MVEVISVMTSDYKRHCVIYRNLLVMWIHFAITAKSLIIYLQKMIFDYAEKRCIYAMEYGIHQKRQS